jgi:hypothetical protein
MEFAGIEKIGGIIGAGGEIEWKAPTRPGDHPRSRPLAPEESFALHLLFRRCLASTTMKLARARIAALDDDGAIVTG